MPATLEGNHGVVVFGDVVVAADVVKRIVYDLSIQTPVLGVLGADDFATEGMFGLGPRPDDRKREVEFVETVLQSRIKLLYE